MAPTEEQLATLLIGVGKKLQEMLPTTEKELLAVLDRLEVYLSRVEQSPSKVIQSAVGPAKEALVDDRLIRHANVDVKVAVASCLSEITRIAAPDVPFKDDQMKDVFQLIVSTFESLPDRSGQSYTKRITILDTVAKVRSCVVMLDLECDELILAMFRLFISAIRDYHPENVFTSMESIMMRVIDESEEISSDLLFCILDSVKKENMEVRPVARSMMRRVIQTCADKLRPHIKNAAITKELVLADYDEVLSHLCLETSAETAGQSEHSGAFVVKVLANTNESLEPSSDDVLISEDTPVIIIEGPPGDDFSDVLISTDIPEVEADTFSVSSTMQDSKFSNHEAVPDKATAGPSAVVCNSDGVGVETYTQASESINPIILDDNLDAEKVDENSKTGLLAEITVKKRGRKPIAKNKSPKSKLGGKLSSHSQGQVPSIEASDHSSAKPMETENVSSKLISGEADQSDKDLDECSKSKTVISISENRPTWDMKASTSAVSNLEERTTALKVDASDLNLKTATPAVNDLEDRTVTPKVDASEAKTTAPQADISIEKTDALSDESSKEDTVIPTINAVPEVAVPMVNEPPKVESSVGNSPEQLAVLSKATHGVENDHSKINRDIKRRGKGLSKDMRVEEPDAPNDENPEDTVIQISDAVLEGAAPTVDELPKVDSSVGKSPDQLAVLSKDTRGVENDPSDTNSDIERRGQGSSKDFPVVKTDAPNDENSKKGTLIQTSDALLEAAAPVDAEPLKEVESRVGRAPEQLAVLFKDRDDVEGDPFKTNGHIKRRGRSLRKSTIQKHAAEAGDQNNRKDATTSPKEALKSFVNEEDMKETPKSGTKRRKIEENKKESEDYGEELVGSKVKVWWPADKRYYKGVIRSFDSAKKKHEVLYTDGDVEHLILRKQSWEVINPNVDSDVESEERTPEPNPASKKHYKGEELSGGTSRKRLGRTLRDKRSSNKLGCTRDDLLKSGSKSRSTSRKWLSRASSKAKSASNERKADVSEQSGKSRADNALSSVNGKDKADEPKRIGKSTTEDAQGTGNKNTSDFKATCKTETDKSSVEQKDPKGHGNNAGEETRLTRFARRSKTRESNKSESTPKTTSAAKSKDRSSKTFRKLDIEVSTSESESKVTGVATDKQIPSAAKEAGSRKRKAPVLYKINKIGVKSRRKRGRK